ncbi:TetR/AcrR family transcriptional regulator [Rhodoblastus sp.]|jgi:TetR/AcrR family transcriptional repressor of nem operon|uniref:TetR/AcrR family transcriptional regulator n=1 Tax=Rhodoblastus sp. TaxID=1962975 RepID=UPI0025EB3AC5|nr:TetR/AcrR family transcriptional regulator [Rhodoblastus sp.]
MRKSREAAAESRRNIVETAAKLLRERGLGVGLADIMAAAGLTHGGFYRHFASKEALVAEVLQQALDEKAESLVARDGLSAQEALKAYVALYLSSAHVDNPGKGCPIAALGAVAARSEETARALAAGAEKLAANFAADLSGGSAGDPVEARRRAVAMLASMVGAVVVARAVGDSPLRAEVLDALRAEPAFRNILEN